MEKGDFRSMPKDAWWC